MSCWIALHTFITFEPSLPDRAEVDQTAVQHAVASLALGFTPRVALLDEAVLMDVTGSLRLFGGLARLMQLLEQCIHDFFVSNQVVALVKRAQGATSLIAIGRLRLSLYKPQTSTSPVKKRVADLPMHTLSAARPHLGVLERIGCRTWDDLLRLPRDGVARRFGAALLESLDRASGKLPDDYKWLLLPEQFDQKHELDALVTHGPALMAGIEPLLFKLQAWLLGRQSGICALKITWHLDKRRDVLPTSHFEIRTAQPTQNLRHVTRLVAEHLAQQKLAAPAHSISLQSLVIESLADSAAATASLLMQAQQKGDTWVELTERLSARLGSGNVQVWQPQADHRPEQMQRWVNALPEKNPSNPASEFAIKSVAANAHKTSARAVKGLKKTALRVARLSSHRTEALYPSWLLPEPLRLQTVGNSPVYSGRLTRLAGPQRLELGGWLMAGEGPAQSAAERLNPPTMRDYFIYRSEQGSLLWIYSERLKPAQNDARTLRAWYLHGFFA